MIIQGVTLKNINVYDASFNSSGALLYLDPGNAASYPGSGTVWTDLSGNNNTATLVGSPTFTNAGPASYFSFNGTGSQYASTIDFKYNQPYTGKTVMAVIRINASAWTPGLDQYRGIFGSNTLFSSNRNFNTYIHHDASNNLQIHYSANNVGGLSNNVSIPANTWAIVAVTQTISGVVTFYLNGQAVGTATGQTFAQWIDGQTNQFIGRTDNNWYGDIGVTAVYGRALTADEIQQNYNAVRLRYGL